MLEKIAATLGRMDAHLGLIRDASMISFIALAKQSKGDMVGVDVDDMVETADVCFFVLVFFWILQMISAMSTDGLIRRNDHCISNYCVRAPGGIE
jgi:hypothetical protein